MGMTSGASHGVSADINVTPMADIMLVLLIIFMITTPLLQSGVAVNKAKARNAAEAPDVESENATTITVTRDKVIYVNADMVAADKVTEKVQERVAVAPELPLFVKSDVATPYGAVVDVINKARDAGVEKIGLMVDREREGRVQ